MISIKINTPGMFRYHGFFHLFMSLEMLIASFH